jgi:hypothetical protein
MKQTTSDAGKERCTGARSLDLLSCTSLCSSLTVPKTPQHIQ